jgi:ABC-type phosphate transport system auxiliary subunit
MAAPRIRRSRKEVLNDTIKDLQEKINIQKEELERNQKLLKEAVEELMQIQTKELLEAVNKSGKSMEDIMKFLESK